LTRKVEQGKAQIKQLNKRIEEAEQKRTHVNELERAASLYARLGNLLRADQFIQ